MVIAQVLHIRNNTLRTFTVKAGDPFYTAHIDGKPCVDGSIAVTPGFDQAIEGLVVPWESMTRRGLEVAEEGSEQLLRVIVGPVEDDAEGKDWLQYRTGAWEPFAHERWLSLGRRHLLGAVGASVDLQLTFRDARGFPGDGPAELYEVTHFGHATSSASPTTVFLNVFDLASAMSIPNAMLCNTLFNTIGAFHAAVEVYGEEWSFYRTPNPTACGVCKSQRVRQHPVHIYRQSVPLGRTALKEWEVRYLIRGKLAAKWAGGGYHLLNRNCIHFCDELLLCLGVKGVPPWVRGLHETGASVLRLTWPISLSYEAEPKQLRDGEPGDEERHPRDGPSGLPPEGQASLTARSSYGGASEAAATGGGVSLSEEGAFIGGATQEVEIAARRYPWLRSE